MIIFVTALQIEAEPVIQRYRLRKDMSIHAFPVYRNESVFLIISGIGKLRAAMAVSFLFGLERFSALDSILINIGFCGTQDPALSIGELVLAGKITDDETKRDYYPDLLNDPLIPVVHLRCHSKRVYRFAVNEPDNDSVRLPLGFDMESAGLMESASRFITADRILILKVVSDNLSPGHLDRDMLLRLLTHQLPVCDTVINAYQKIHQSLVNPVILSDRQQVHETARVLHLSESQRMMLMQTVRRYRLSGGDPIPDLIDARQQQAAGKNERKQILDTLSTKWSQH